MAPLLKYAYLLYEVLSAVRPVSPKVPKAKLDTAEVHGIGDGVVNQFLGIPFAQPPIGDLRLRLPEPLPPYAGVIKATAPGDQCFQQALALPPGIPDDIPPEMKALLEGFLNGNANTTQSEDCLNLNVIVPAGLEPGAKLPVVAWIYGGGFQVGSNLLEPGQVVVNRSIEIGQPVIFVSMNYRLSAFGFLGGSEVEKEGLGNLGLHDQRLALRWIQKYISAFGGDPQKVTIWGQSAGALSVALQMTANGGNAEGLFRGAWMDSGSVLSTSSISTLQPTFDFIASEVGCASSPDALGCLREVPADRIQAAMNETPSIFTFKSLTSPWIVHTDGVFIEDNSQKLILDGSFADVPFVIGSNEDEGTLFTLAMWNITTEAALADYLTSTYFPGASNANMTRLLELYPADPAAGSPFGTGEQFAFTPEYKRLAAIQGDLFFQATRRFLLHNRRTKSTARSFLSRRMKVPGLGATHGTELANIFGGGDMTDFLVRFVNTLDPNGGRSELHWPPYTPRSPKLLAFVEGSETLEVISDTFRKEATEFLTQLSFEHPF